MKKLKLKSLIYKKGTTEQTNENHWICDERWNKKRPLRRHTTRLIHIMLYWIAVFPWKTYYWLILYASSFWGHRYEPPFLKYISLWTFWESWVIPVFFLVVKQILANPLGFVKLIKLGFLFRKEFCLTKRPKGIISEQLRKRTESI